MLLLTLCLVAILNLFLGFIVIFNNHKKAVNIIFFCLTFLGDGWLLTNYLADHSTSVTMGILWTRLTMSFGLLAAYSILYFLGVFIQESKFSKIVKKIIAIPLILTIIPLLFTKYIIETVTFKDSVAEITFGGLIIIYLIIFSFILVLSLVTLIMKMKNTKGSDRIRLSFLAMGLFMTFVLATITNLILPSIFNIYTLSSYGADSLILLIGFTSYAIIKHRLMDIRFIVARSVAFTVLLALIGLFYTTSMIWLEKILFPESSGTLTPDQIIFRIVLTMIVVFFFQPLKRFITKKTDRVFFKQSYDPEKLLDTLSHTMASSIVLIELLFKVMNILIEEMKVSKGFFVLLDGKGKVYTTQGIGYKKSMQINPKDIETLTKDGICIYDDLDEGSRLKNILKKYDAFVAQPLKNGDRVTGVLLLGEKSSGDMYSAQDIRIFEIVGPQVSVAIENAKSYEEIQKFNAVLRSEVKKATTDLERANQNLRELDKAKDEFITMASHQLRTPLTAIKGYLSMLLEGDAGEIKVGQYEFVEEAYSGATRMVALINDLLNVSRMETGRFFLEPTDFELTRLINEEIKQLEKTAKDKGLEVEFTKKGRGDIKLCADEMKVRQVVMNFIDNAIYYTINGKIKVRVSQDKESAYFEVTDNGIGVPKEQQKHLFTKFYRAENARRTRPDGTGLGLFMAKKVIEEHGGEIIFHSEEGRGSTFGFKLPKNANIRRSAVSAATKNVPTETRVVDAPQAEKEEVLKYEPEEATVA